MGLKTPLSKIFILGDVLFWMQFYWDCKINDIVNKFLLAGGKFMPEMHLRQPRFTYGACIPFTKNKERIQNFKKKTTGNSRYELWISRNELDKDCF